MVELLAVIVVIASVMVFAIPAITDTNKNARDKLTDMEKNNLKEAGKMLALDVDNSATDIYKCNGWVASYCTKQNSKWTKIEISVSNLKSHGYFTDNDNHIDGDIIVSIDNSHNVTIKDN